MAGMDAHASISAAALCFQSFVNSPLYGRHPLRQSVEYKQTNEQKSMQQLSAYSVIAGAYEPFWIKRVSGAGSMRRGNKHVTAIIALVLLNGASPEPYPQIRTVPVGGVLTSTGGTKTIKGILLPSEDDIMHRRFSAGFYPQVREDGRYTYHSFFKGTAIDGYGALTGLRDARLLRASKERQELCAVLGVLAMGLKACDTAGSFERIERTVPDPTKEHQELTYDGIVGHVIRLGYSRTSAGPLAHTSSQQAEYDLDASTSVAFQNARIRVIKADSQSITFAVVKPLDET